MNKLFIGINNWWKLSTGDFTFFNVSLEWIRGSYYVCSIMVLDIELKFGWDEDE